MQEINMWWDRATKITPSYSDMPKGGGDDKIQSAIDMITMLQDSVNRDIDKLIDYRRKVDKAIASLKDERERKVLIYRYIHLMTWEKIAEEMNYCYMQVCRIHGYALTKIML